MNTMTNTISDESEYESDETDHVFIVDEHIVLMAKSYWRGDYEFIDSYDDEDPLWLCAMAGVVSNIGETKLPSPVTKPISSYLMTRLSSGEMPPFARTVRSGRAGLKLSCCQLRRSWTVALVLRQWIKCLMDRHQ